MGLCPNFSRFIFWKPPLTNDTFSDASLGHGGDGRQVRRHDTRAGGPSQGAVDCGREVRPQVTEPGGRGVQASDASLGHEGGASEE